MELDFDGMFEPEGLADWPFVHWGSTRSQAAPSPPFPPRPFPPPAIAERDDIARVAKALEALPAHPSGVKKPGVLGSIGPRRRARKAWEADDMAGFLGAVADGFDPKTLVESSVAAARDVFADNTAIERSLADMACERGRADWLALAVWLGVGTRAHGMPPYAKAAGSPEADELVGALLDMAEPGREDAIFQTVPGPTGFDALATACLAGKEGAVSRLITATLRLAACSRAQQAAASVAKARPVAFELGDRARTPDQAEAAGGISRLFYGLEERLQVASGKAPQAPAGDWLSPRARAASTPPDRLVGRRRAPGDTPSAAPPPAAPRPRRG